MKVTSKASVALGSIDANSVPVMDSGDIFTGWSFIKMRYL